MGQRRTVAATLFRHREEGDDQRGRMKDAHTETHQTMMLKYWEELREAVRPEIFSPPRHQDSLIEMRQHPLRGY